MELSMVKNKFLDYVKTNLETNHKMVFNGKGIQLFICNLDNLSEKHDIAFV
jgi:hypothetical protein